MFENIKNVTFDGFCKMEGQGTSLVVYMLEDIPADKWNEMANKQRQLLSVKDGGAE